MPDQRSKKSAGEIQVSGHVTRCDVRRQFSMRHELSRIEDLPWRYRGIFPHFLLLFVEHRLFRGHRMNRKLVFLVNAQCRRSVLSKLYRAYLIDTTYAFKRLLRKSSKQVYQFL